MRAIQGMETSQTTFLEDGSIVQDFSDGRLTTTFSDDGSVIQKFQSGDHVITKRTIFRDSGDIEEVIS